MYSSFIIQSSPKDLVRNALKNDTILEFVGSLIRQERDKRYWALICSIMFEESIILFKEDGYRHFATFLEQVGKDRVAEFINTPSGNDTILMQAVRTKNLATVTLLLSYGANPHAQGEDGQTAASLAEYLRDEKIQFLLNWNSKTNAPVQNSNVVSAFGYQLDPNSPWANATVYSNNSMFPPPLPPRLPRPREKTALEKAVDKLTVIAANNNFVLFNVAGDGNCFYLAMEDQIKFNNQHCLTRAEQIPEYSAHELRQIASSYLMYHKEEMAGFCEDNTSIEWVIDKNSRNGTWVSNVVITALQKALKLNLVLYNTAFEKPTMLNYDPTWPTCYLGYVNEVHYVSFRPKLALEAEQTLSGYMKQPNINR